MQLKKILALCAAGVAGAIGLSEYTTSGEFCRKNEHGRLEVTSDNGATFRAATGFDLNEDSLGNRICTTRDLTMPFRP